MTGRLATLRRVMRGAGLVNLAVLNLKNVRYLTGFTGSSGACLVTGRTAVFITDFRYRSQAAHQVRPPFRYAEYAHPLRGLLEEVKKLRLQSLAFEEEHVSHGDFRRLRREAKGVRLRPASGLVEGARARKDPEELRLLRRGARINGEALAEAARTIRPGVSEKTVALALERTMCELGASGPAFDTIVVSGSRGALPHGIASARKLRRGDLITIDFGAVVEGYHADTTRAFVLGKPSRKVRTVFEVVLEAQIAAVRAVGPGVRGQEVDAAARTIINQAGYGEAFGHGTGHGVGLDIHEAPRLGKGSRDVLQPGMVVTVEPGVYLPGWGGVRIEDMVLVTETGRSVLTRSIPKELPVL